MQTLRSKDTGFSCRREKLTVLDALFGHLNWSLRVRNTGFTQVLVHLVVVLLHCEKLSFLQSSAVSSVANLHIPRLAPYLVFFIVRNSLFL